MSRDAGPLQLGLVGCGRIAHTYLEALRTLPELRLTCVADARVELARDVGAHQGCDAVADYRAVLDGRRLDAVLLCTPPGSHMELADWFLDRGVHVLCEKPLAISAAEAERVLRKAEAADLQLMMASKFRYAADVIKARGIVGSGILGKVILFENWFCARVAMRDRWNADPEVSGGGVLIDNGTHAVDIARYLIGPIASVMAVEGQRVQALPVEDTCRLLFRSEGGAMGSVDLSWSLHKERDAYVEVFGPDGALSIGWRASKYRQSEKLDWIAFGTGYDKTAAFARQLANFAGVIRGREAPVISAEDSLASVRVIEAAYRSMRAGDWVQVEGASQPAPAAPRAATPATEVTSRPADAPRVHRTALIEDGVSIGARTAIWDSVHVRHHATIGQDCIVGEKSYIAYGVAIGDRVKINAFVYLCAAVTIEDGVMISAGTTFTNDRFPRATTPDLAVLRGSDPDETTRPTRVREGATIGARCVIGCDLTIGRFAMVGMGSVVTHSVADFHLVVGSPARPVGCVCRCGQLVARFDRAEPGPLVAACPACRRLYSIDGQVVTETAGGAADGDRSGGCRAGA